MNTRSITFRLAAWCAGIALLVCLGFGIYTYLGLGYYLRRSQTDTLQKRAHQVAAILAAHVERDGDAVTIDLLKTSYAPEHNDRFIRIRRPDGSTLYASGQPSDRSFDPAAVPLLPLPAKQSDSGNARALGNLLLVQTSAQTTAGRYVIDCGASKLPGERVLSGFLAVLGLGLPLMVGVAVTGGAILVRRALGPVREITDAAREITSYNLGRRLPVARTHDELQGLSVVLNQMIGRLDEAFQHSRRFTADASHELRTPLTIMRVELESITQETDLPPATREKVASVLEETERLAKTVQGLFAITRLEAGEALMDVTRFDLSELVQSTAEQMALLADEKGLVVDTTACTPVEVAGDRFRLKQIIVNLLDNAIKYSPAGGEITLSTGIDAGGGTLEVADRGPGIPEEALPQVFDRFFRADAVRTHSENGAGLGLSIVRSICQAHGGSVHAANRPQGGCRIVIHLPLATPSPRASTVAVPLLASAPALSTDRSIHRRLTAADHPPMCEA